METMGGVQSLRFTGLNIFDNEILPVNYTLSHKDCPSHGGGMLIAINNQIPRQIIFSPTNLVHQINHLRGFT